MCVCACVQVVYVACAARSGTRKQHKQNAHNNHTQANNTHKPQSLKLKETGLQSEVLHTREARSEVATRLDKVCCIV